MNMDIKMLKNMLAAIGAELPSAKDPTNKVAEFVDNEITVLLPDDPDIVDIFRGVYVGAANNDPNRTLGVLIRVHNDIGELVKELQENQSDVEEDDPGPEGEPELDDSIDASEEIEEDTEVE